ncbi:aspartate ammonia-lyase [Acinetobacter puyangensis]|uniref:aspartate ammonia-lyase n=1 Tax=Acinetobacter puyangensis TaxID=1096779 RepID=UPI003A4D7AFD
MSSRREHDLLGEREIPADAYYGIHTQRALDNFQISQQQIGQNHLFIKAMAQVKQASALTNYDYHKISKFQCDAILYACKKIIDQPQQWQHVFPLDIYQGGAGTSINMNCNEVIANIALKHLGYEKGRYDIIHPNDVVNKSQSTNDVYPTALRLSLYYQIDELIISLNHIIKSIDKKSREFKSVIKMGRTQLQDAVPMTLGQEFKAYATLLREDRTLIQKLRPLLLEINLGATAIGTGVNTGTGYAGQAVQHLKKITGLELKGASDYIEATSDCGVFILISSCLKRLACKLSKICNDLRLLSSGPRTGLNEINLPQLQAGSSIMPAKVNPVIPEVVNQIAFKVIGNDMTVTMAAEAGQLQLNVMEPVIAACMNESLSLLCKAIESLDQKCIQGISANAKQCHATVLNSIGIITLLDPILGHECCDLIGKQCIAENKTVPEVVLEKKLLTQQQLNEIFSVQNLVSDDAYCRVLKPIAI